MKLKSFLGLGLLFALAVSCTINEPAEDVAGKTDMPVISATLAAGTRVSPDEDYNVLWNKGDALSVFYGNDANLKYVLIGNGGETSGDFEYVSGTPKPKIREQIVAAYPYSDQMTYSSGMGLAVTLPTEQTYAENGFDPEANLMVAVSETTTMQFYNMLGYLVLRLYADEAQVESIVVRGNSPYDDLSGVVYIDEMDDDIAVRSSYYGGPGFGIVAYGETADYVVLKCPTPVDLSNTTADTAVYFWICLPPMWMDEGFTMEVHFSDGSVFTQPYNDYVNIVRSEIFEMDPLRVQALVTGVELDEEEISVEVGETATLVATVSPEDATDAVVTWTSSDETVATVSDEGVVTGVAPGEVTITVTTQDGGFTAECAVTVPEVPVTRPYKEPFDEAGKLGKFTIDDVDVPEDLNYVWSHSSATTGGKKIFFAKGSSFVDQEHNYEAESWLVSPRIDLRNETQCVLSFDYALNFGEPDHYPDQFYLMVFDGTDWTRVDIPEMSLTPSWTFYPSVIDLSDFCGDIIQVAFVYNSFDENNGNGALTIELQNVVFDREAQGVIYDVPESMSFIVAAKEQPIGAWANSGATLSYESSDETVAKVNASGYVTPIAVGTAVITITAPATGIYTAAEATVSVTVSAPTKFAFFNGAFQDGEYVIAYTTGNTTRAMKNTVASNRLSFEVVTPNEDDVIVNPDASIVWTIAKAPNDNYWTIYNAAVKKYAASTGTKNQATLVADGTGDKALWSIASGFEFINKYNDANKINANLRNNTTYGFACYSTGTGGPIALYRKVEEQ